MKKFKIEYLNKKNGRPCTATISARNENEAEAKLVTTLHKKKVNWYGMYTREIPSES